MKQKNDLLFKLKRKEELDAFMEALDGFRDEHDLDYKIYFDLKICLEEVIINIFKHGQGDGKKAIEIDVSISGKDDGVVVAIVEDNAIPFNLVEMESGVDFQSDLEDRPIGGVGIHLVKNLTDGLAYEQLQNGNNKVTLSKKTSV